MPDTDTGASTAPTKRTQPICSTCKSTDVLCDAWAEWNAEKQDWELRATFDAAHCNTCDGPTKLEWQEITETRTDRIRRLNDEMRAAVLSGNVEPYGTMVVTIGIQSLLRDGGEPAFQQLRTAIAEFDAFDEDNDPHLEHDFGALTFLGKKIFFKLDYYAPDMMHRSEDPSNREKTVRVLTIMLAEEY